VALAVLSGELVPKAYHGVLHPVLVTAVVANAGLALQSKLLGISYAAAQKAYLAKVSSQQQYTHCVAVRLHPCAALFWPL
jgi:hypothetical protein